MALEDYLQSLRTGGQLAANQQEASLQNANSGQQAALQAYLQGQGQQQKAALDLATAKKAIDMAPEGASVKAGEVSVGQDPYSRMMIMQQNMGIKAVKGATDYYNKNVGKLQQQAQAAEQGLASVNDPSNMGSLGQARTLMLKSMGMSRYNDNEAKAVLPPTIYSTISGFLNQAGGENNPLNAQQAQVVNTFFKHTLNAVQQQHEMLKNSALTEYQMQPGADPQRAQALQGQMGKPFDAYLSQLGQKYQGGQPAQAPSPAQQPAPPPAAGLAQGQQAGPNTASSGPMTFEQFKASRKNAGQ